MGNLGWSELLVILVLALLLFGAKRLPEMGRAFGNAIAEFKRGMKGEEKTAQGDAGSPKIG